MNWDDVKYFLAVARKGSISAGAKQLGIQHSTLSRRLRALEDKMGTELIERKKSGYQLTQAGLQLQQAALKMELEMLSVEANLSGMQEELQGELKISAINNMASGILMPIFASFAEQYPKITLHLMVTNKNISLAEREADIVIRLSNDPLDTLIGKRLVTVASAAYASRDYLKRLKQQEVDESWLGVTCCGFHQSWTKQSRPNDNHSVYSDDTLLTQSAIINGLGIA